MSLADAAQALGLPEALVKRSAEARAAETGQSVDEILAAWAGGEAPAAARPEPAPEPEPEEAAEEARPAEEAAPETPAAPAPGPAPAEVATPSRVPERAPVPAEVTPAEAAHLPEVITVPTAGIKERTNFVIPRWLSALMIIAPLLALFALGGSATGACGEGTELATDVISGEIVNCDGSEFTGGVIGGGGTDFLAVGADIYPTCAGCHGANGQGQGAFPALTGVLTTFGACGDHLEWVSLGSDGFRARGDSTYGDTNKSINGGMPAFGGQLTDEQLAAVVAFERVRFGGQERETALIDCGLVEPEGGEGEGDTTGTTVPGTTTVPAGEGDA